MDIHYSITFHSYWHCGSGLAAGASVDALPIKDINKMPFIPGKTLKGLLREAVEEIEGLKSSDGQFVPDEAFLETFGYFKDEASEVRKASAFFSDAVLSKKEYSAITQYAKEEAQKYLYESIASTAIDDNGIAKKNSLRKIEVVVPCTLYAMIKDVPEGYIKTLEKAMGYIKCLGCGRNRGLGRCTFSIEKGGNS